MIKMQLITYQIAATLNLNCFRPVGLYSDRVHVVRIAFVALTDKLTLLLRCTKLFGEAMSSYAAFNGKLHADD